MKTLTNETAVQIHLGAIGIKALYEESLTAKQVDFVCLSSNYSRVVGAYFDKDYAPRLFGSQVATREILPNNPVNEANNKAAKNQVRYMEITETSESDLLLFNGKAVLVSYNPESPFAVEVSDKELVANFRNQFEALWKELSA